MDSDPKLHYLRDFRAFIEEHKSGLLVRKARHKLEDLADEAFTTTGRDKAALERFQRVHFDSVKVEAARAVLAEIAGRGATRQQTEAAGERRAKPKNSGGEGKRHGSARRSGSRILTPRRRW